MILARLRRRSEMGLIMIIIIIIIIIYVYIYKETLKYYKYITTNNNMNHNIDTTTHKYIYIYNTNHDYRSLAVWMDGTGYARFAKYEQERVRNRAEPGRDEPNRLMLEPDAETNLLVVSCLL